MARWVGEWNASLLLPCFRKSFSLSLQMPLVFNFTKPYIILMSGEGGKVTQENCREESDLDPGMLDSRVRAVPSMPYGL